MGTVGSSIKLILRLFIFFMVVVFAMGILVGEYIDILEEVKGLQAENRQLLYQQYELEQQLAQLDERNLELPLGCIKEGDTIAMPPVD